MTLGATTFSIAASSRMTFGIMTPSVKRLSIAAFSRMTLNKMTHNKITLIIMTLDTTTLSIMILGIMTHGIITLVILMHGHINILYNDTHHYDSNMPFSITTSTRKNAQHNANQYYDTRQICYIVAISEHNIISFPL
jgi:hypothetical protein